MVTKQTPILPLVILRIAFGTLLLVSTIRFVANGWIAEFYVKPDFHFTYWGFSWIRPLPAAGMTAVFILMGLAALGIALGLFYRLNIVTFFLLFTYVELLDKTYYLNHYYFISWFSFLLIFLPLHHNHSLDARLRPTLKTDRVPLWTIYAVRLQLSIVYFFAGAAKLNSDWLLHALPLRIWLPAQATLPFIGPVLDELWLAYILSWGGMLFDLTIPFWLMWSRTRPFAYLAVICFHVSTGILFNIGMFPWIMIACTLVFFSYEDLPRPLPSRLSQSSIQPPARSRRSHKAVIYLLTGFFLIQLLFPLRHWLYPGDDKWTDEGFRQSWKVMLVEKTGHILFHVTDPSSGRSWAVYPADYLTPVQEKQMAFQPDMILEFAHFLAEMFAAQGYLGVEVRAEAYVSLNGRASRLLIDPTVNLAAEKNSLWPKPWILH